jgi:hypothetical protein
MRKYKNVDRVMISVRKIYILERAKWASDSKFKIHLFGLNYLNNETVAY